MLCHFHCARHLRAFCIARIQAVGAIIQCAFKSCRFTEGTGQKQVIFMLRARTEQPICRPNRQRRFALIVCDTYLALIVKNNRQHLTIASLSIFSLPLPKYINKMLNFVSENCSMLINSNGIYWLLG